MINIRLIINKIYIGGLIILPIILILLPADYFDTGKSMCLSVILLDTECIGCGMTRAIQHLIHFDFKTAAHFNKLSFIVLPILIVVWALEIKRTLKTIKKYKA